MNSFFCAVLLCVFLSACSSMVPVDQVSKPTPPPQERQVSSEPEVSASDFKTPDGLSLHMNPSNDYKVILEALRAYVRTVEAPTTLYSWCENCLGGNSQDEIKSYVALRTSLFFDLNKRDAGMLGNGLYLALDPVASRSYGGENWNLLQLELKRGVNYVIDPVGHESEDGRKDYRTKLAGLGCVIQRPEDKNIASIQTFLEMGDAGCRKLKFRVLKDLNIKAIFYHWDGTATRDCSARPLYAVVAIDKDIFNYAASSALIANLKPSLPGQAKIVNNFFEEMNHAALVESWSKLSDADFAKVQRIRFFGCRSISSEVLPEK